MKVLLVCMVFSRLSETLAVDVPAEVVNNDLDALASGQNSRRRAKPGPRPTTSPTTAPTPEPPTPPAAPTPAPDPSPAAPTPAPKPSPELQPCLCIFDVDRTLTAEQHSQSCSGTKAYPGVQDPAYKHGDLRVSEAAQNLDKTHCNACYMGIISAGGGGGSGKGGEREILHGLLSIGPGKDVIAGVTADQWSSGHPVTSPFVVHYPDGHKQEAVPGIVAWYATHAKVTISDEDVYFYDDRSSNIAGFSKRKYNAHQVSCAQRQKSNEALGYCGATTAEINEMKGNGDCAGSVDITV